MNPPRYITVNEKSPYPVKRRIRGNRGERENEPAITVLPPDSYVILNQRDVDQMSSPRFYRAVAPKSAKNSEVSSFVILGDTIYSPVQSRPGSPSGRISPFRGHGFKSAGTVRSSSRPVSPFSSPKKTISAKEKFNRTGKSGIENRERFNRYVGGLPPKSPIKGKKTQPEEDVDPSNASVTSTVSQKTTDDRESSADTEIRKIINSELDDETTENTESVKTDSIKGEADDLDLGDKNSEEAIEIDKKKEKEEEQKREPEGLKPENSSALDKALEITKKSPSKVHASLRETDESLEKLRPVGYYRGGVRGNPPKSPVSVQSKLKAKNEKNAADNQQKEKLPVARVTGKPPVPPRKIGIKTSLKASDDGKLKNKSARETAKNKLEVKEKQKLATKELKKPAGQDAKANNQKKEQISKPQEVETERQADNTLGAVTLEDLELDHAKKTKQNEEEKKTEEVVSVIEEKKSDGKDETGEKLVPCYQPDKCHIAPPTMASPQPIMTPSISTPSAADLATSTTKSSQSISAAPTTVTPSNMSSLSSTVVLTGNLARKEISKQAEVKSNSDEEKKEEPTKTADPVLVETNGSVVGAESIEMVKAGDFSKKKSPEEIASAKKVIKADPDMEVLSPNNLRNSPPRMPPPNMAWDEER